MKKIIAVLAALFMLAVSFGTVEAHSSYQISYFDNSGSSAVGREANGWIIDETAHSGATTIYYKFSSNVSDTLKAKVRSGEYKWKTIIVFQDTDSNTIGTVRANSQTLPTDIKGRFCDYYSDSNGHLTSWVVELNTKSGVTLTAADITHEFGHVIGLNDLTNPANIDKIMYGYDNGTATVPQTQDKWGAKVILGIHSSHTWAYEYVSQSQHHKYCTSCGGYKTQACTYDANGTCTKCGHHVSINLLPPPEPVTAVLPKAERRRSEA